MNVNDIDLSCDPANARRSQVPGPAGVKLITEVCAGVDDQATVTENVTGNARRNYIQQAFHPSLFISRPRSSSLGNNPSTPIITKEKDLSPTPPKTITIDDDDNICPPTWQRIPTHRNSKRKKLSNSPPSMEIRSQPTQNSPSCINVSNRYSILPLDMPDESVESAEKQTHTKKVSKPPPIILYGITDISKLTELLNSSVPSDSYTYKIINRDQLRVMAQTSVAYKNIIDLIRKNGLIGHTFTPKDKRSCRIVIKNLHHTTPKEAIVEEIEKTGNKVRGEIICAISRRNNKPLDMFFVNVEPGPNNPELKRIESIYHTKVRIEDPRKTNEIPQCSRCQQYGHTKNNCMRPYRCVKCTEGHRTIDCPKKDRNTPATCTLCLGDHPANYKGCQVYKEIRARKILQPPHKKAQLLNKKYARNNTVPYQMDDFPQLQPSRNARQQPPSSSSHTPYPGNNTHWNKEQENIQSQPTSSLEQIIMKQSEKIDILIQQMGTLMGLLTTLVAQYNK